MLSDGETFAGYVIERRLGRGGMGSVFLARHPRLPRLVALKVLNAHLFEDAEMRLRFEREADLVARLDHPNITTIYDCGVEAEQPWISMRYVDGTDAAHVDTRQLPAEGAVHIVTEIAKALDFAHDRGVLHRDVKPANILLERAIGADRRVFLTDFGIARSAEESAQLTTTGSLNATLGYASPEQLAGAPLDQRTDQYSLACSLFRLLTGTVPFDTSSTAAAIDGHMRLPPPKVTELRPGLPGAMDEVLFRALAKAPAQRFDSCTGFAAAAARALGTVRPPAVLAPGPGSAVRAPGPGPHPPADYRNPLAGNAVAPPNPTVPLVSSGIPPRRRGTALGWIGAGVLALSVVLVLAAGVIALAVSGTRSDETDHAAPPPSTEPTSAPASSERASPTPDVSESRPPPTDEPTSRIGESAAVMSGEFPHMLPPADARVDLNAGTGYQNAGCMTFRPSTPPPSSGHDDPGFGDWITVWHCFGGDNRASYRFYLYRSTDDARRVLDSLPPNTRSSVSKGGHDCTNHLLTGSERFHPRLLTGFASSSGRDRILMYSAGFIATEGELLDWWNAAPLG